MKSRLPLHRLHPLLPLALSLALVGPGATARVVGQNLPPPPLTAERVETLPAHARAAWLDYLSRSSAQQAQDRAALAAERAGLDTWPAPPESHGRGAETMPLNKPAAWYASEEAVLIGRNILSYQTPAGGWGKNQPRDRPPRARGQAFVGNNNSKFATPGDFDLPKDAGWSYVGTIDNDATITEIRFLTRLAAQAPGAAGGVYREAALRGIDYVLHAQFPNGGWPQVWPLQGGYHDAVTLNDDAVVEVAELLMQVAKGSDGFEFFPQDRRLQAAQAVQRSIQLLLDAQLRQGGQRTLWAQQYDALTLEPVSARNYEPGAPCTAESVGVLVFLMGLPEPSREVQAAVHGGIATLERIAVHGRAWDGKGTAEGRRLIDKPGSRPLWARFYSLDTWQPLFGDRDKSLHDDVNELSRERRDGYNWWGEWPTKALKAYEAWSARWARSATKP